MGSTLTKILIVAVLFLGVFGWKMHEYNVELKIRMAEAAKEVRIREAERQITDNVLLQQHGDKNDILAARKEIEKRIEEGVCFTGDAHFDHLMQLLDDDAAARCGKPSGNAAH